MEETKVLNKAGEQIATISGNVLDFGDNRQINIEALGELADQISFRDAAKSLRELLLRTGQLMAAVINSDYQGKFIAPDTEDIHVVDHFAEEIKKLEPGKY